MGKWTENELTSPLRNVYLKPCIHLKSENVNIEIKGAACENFCIFQILHFKIGKWTQIELTSPKEKYNLLHNLSGRGGGGAHYVFLQSMCLFTSSKCPFIPRIATFQNCPFIFQKSPFVFRSAFFSKMPYCFPELSFCFPEVLVSMIAQKMQFLSIQNG